LHLIKTEPRMIGGKACGHINAIAQTHIAMAL
jgi:hypothetical protein